MNKITSFIQKTIIATITIISFPVIALKSDIQQLLNISSDKQSVDFKKNIIIFKNNVIIKQGSIDIRANKVVVTRQKNNLNKIMIESIGSPVTFYQLQDNGKQTKGQATNIRYEVDKKIIILTGNASIKQLDSYIIGNKITYIISEQKIEAFSKKGNQVTTVLLPTQLKK
ncbi:Lipopolysaccharide export system protein LptA [Candidatus Providencia siddallii]|uniref:Lipopolysaccharide export system protein LptA n=1 Tax=Candidatus Providencia siddallii TaxID=1715285 RepID=A0A0M6W847_9GAMM|nr:Lipopolysaccharide export system protein LptA [Candidatus Providencia siddallii]